MEFFLDPSFKKEKEKRVKLMLPYQINKKLIERNNEALIMHDMPLHRGYEISEDVIDIPRSVIYLQSENRLHSAKAILMQLLK
jgi:ornithine carbamoyltransferase